MNMDKLTNKSREALMNAQNVAVSSGHTELRAIHVLAGLLAVLVFTRAEAEKKDREDPRQ